MPPQNYNSAPNSGAANFRLRAAQKNEIPAKPNQVEGNQIQLMRELLAKQKQAGVSKNSLEGGVSLGKRMTQNQQAEALPKAGIKEGSKNPGDYRREVDLKELNDQSPSLLKFNNHYYEVPTKPAISYFPYGM